MIIKTLTLGTIALALFVMNVSAFGADEVQMATHDGKVVSITDTKLVMTTKQRQQDREHSHMLSSDTKLTLDGKPCKAADIKAGTRIRVTTKAGDAKHAIRIEAIDKNGSFANTHEGKVISAIGNKLVMTNSSSQAEHTCTLTANVRVTCDGDVCKVSDLKPGMRIRVTTEEKEPHSAIRIEAIDKDPEFASL